ncbi:acetolactate synthase-1/2/3 large subunit [Comamonas sp. BIGb0152]|uniref:thiamine pyrophosphate-binding protein n=1 Tax=Comamonas sp. BIGb0152 TaxID=2940601 RepID=UPI00216828E4|nr:thiamine pyrophosphate-binding protein [Comamonas sp. BIGb0152]MCS4295329.1 acetolactate synthase-1/2/3 large subunit [Comamonas sp. BIGb0152]
MADKQQARTGGQLVVDQLLIHGVQQIFTVPGESFLAVLDALYDAPIETTICRQEGGAAMMAEAQGKLSGQPGICMVTRGPGATNASAGLHIAMQDSTPMILFVGQIERSARGREAFQELDYRAVFGSMVKWATEIDDAARIPETIARAFAVATSGRPGPVVIALPEDMLRDAVTVPDARRYQPAPAHAADADVAAVVAQLAAAQNPIIIAGGSRWNAQAHADIAAFAAAHAVPVACSFRRQMVFPAHHANYAGDVGLGVNPKLIARIKQADLVVLLGGRMSEVPSQGYSLLGIPASSGQRLIHVHPDPDELGRVYQADLAMVAAPDSFCAALARLPAAAPRPERQALVQQAHADYLAWSDPAPIQVPGALQMGQLMAHVREVLPADTVWCNGAGNFATWVHRFWPFTHYGSQLAPTSGSMGYGLPAAVGAKRWDKQRTVVCIAGDGDFLMHGQEFATAVQYQLPLIVLLIDNGMYGTIRMHQERDYPNRVSATELRNPDFVAYAKAFGGNAALVEKTEDFAPALAAMRSWAEQHQLPVILHCKLDQQAITPARSLDQIRGTGV